MRAGSHNDSPNGTSSVAVRTACAPGARKSRPPDVACACCTQPPAHPLQIHIHQQRAAEGGAGDVDARQDRAREVCPREVRTRQVRAGQVAGAQVEAGQTAVPQVQGTEPRPAQPRPGQITAPEDAVAEIGAAKVRVGQIGTGQVNVAQDMACAKEGEPGGWAARCGCEKGGGA